MQDTATAALTKQPQDAASRSPRSKHALVRALMLGAQVWVLGCAWPLMDSGRDPRALEYGLALACALALPLGAWARAPGATADASAWLRTVSLLFAFPALLGATCAARPEHWNDLHYTTLGLCTLWLALCVYGASAAALCSEPAHVLATQVRSLEVAGSSPPPTQVRAAKRVWAALCTGFAVALTLVAPTLGGPEELERAFGEAARSAGVLTAVVGGALGVSTLAIFVAQGLREQRPALPAKRREIWGRVLLLLLLALLGAGTYLWIDR